MRLLDGAEGGEAGFVAGFFELELAGAERGGKGGEAEVFEAGGEGADGGADLHGEGLLDLGEAELLAVEAGAGEAEAGVFGAEAPGEGEGEVELPVVGVVAA